MVYASDVQSTILATIVKLQQRLLDFQNIINALYCLTCVFAAKLIERVDQIIATDFSSTLFKFIVTLEMTANNEMP